MMLQIGKSRFLDIFVKEKLIPNWSKNLSLKGYPMDSMKNISSVKYHRKLNVTIL